MFSCFKWNSSINIHFLLPKSETSITALKTTNKIPKIFIIKFAFFQVKFGAYFIFQIWQVTHYRPWSFRSVNQHHFFVIWPRMLRASWAIFQIFRGFTDLSVLMTKRANEFRFPSKKKNPLWIANSSNAAMSKISMGVIQS